jgi:chromosomal replication initiation ATPase DnaA
LGRPKREERDDELRLDPPTPHLDELGRSTARERPLLQAETFVQRTLDALGHTAEELSGRGKQREVVRSREILMTLGVERYGLRVTEMAAVLGARYHSACLWSRRGATRRQDDPAFSENLDRVDAIIASSPPDETQRLAENV